MFMPSVVANPNASTSQSTRLPAPPSSFRMPHVFVIPPEEEQENNPPWCCFDADGLPEKGGGFSSNPDIHFCDDPYLFHPFENDAPTTITRRTFVHQPRSRASMSKKLEKKQRPEAIKIIETKSSPMGQRDARDDSDVVEVVKVKRPREVTELEENIKAKRSKTLKARATKALQSIKNVGRTSQRTHVKDFWTSAESTPGIFKGVQEQIRSQDKSEDRPPTPPVKKGSLSRATSRSLAQLFQPMKPSRLESMLTDHIPPATPPETYHTLVTPNLSSLGYDVTNPSLNEPTSALTTDDILNRPVTPIPSVKKNLNTKFSVRELHRLFSFSSSSPDDMASSPTATVIPFSSTTSSSKLSVPPRPHDSPDVSMEEDIFVDAQFVDLDSPDRRLASRYHRGFHYNDVSPRRLSDLSFEMQLDSLHFDALSFDADDFRFSRTGNVQG